MMNTSPSEPFIGCGRFMQLVNDSINLHMPLCPHLTLERIYQLGNFRRDIAIKSQYDPAVIHGVIVNGVEEEGMDLQMCMIVLADFPLQVVRVVMRELLIVFWW